MSAVPCGHALHEWKNKGFFLSLFISLEARWSIVRSVWKMYIFYSGMFSLGMFYTLAYSMRTILTPFSISHTPHDLFIFIRFQNFTQNWHDFTLSIRNIDAKGNMMKFLMWTANNKYMTWNDFRIRVADNEHDQQISLNCRLSFDHRDLCRKLTNE